MNMRTFKSLILILVFMFFGCKDIKDAKNVGLLDEDDEEEETEDFDFEDENTIEGLIAKYQLSPEERHAVQYLKSVLINPLIANDVAGIKNYTEEEFHEFLLMLGLNKTKEAIADIVVTMRARDEVQDAIYDMADDHPQKQNLESQLKGREDEYLKDLKISCSSDEGYEGAYIALRANSSSFMFKALKGQIDDTLGN
ncbi:MULTISPECIES: hypothetical protein [unclassified Borrelia]|uniref:BTA121 domain-containing protein surface lipoprotein n=1 Tax=unclassified Borrelia TaxID=2649934 RepID=UPI001E34367F|nr:MULTISPECIES: hypothetical protein [unclassified Borrelia]UGQ16769.1 hypothetical protein LSO06_05460 [Borrelia sp. RT5S]UGQ18007.1 hypothetical protein LSO05_06120 [Borrelia sp. RT1S]